MGSPGELFERKRELTVLEGHISRLVDDGQGTTVLLAGPPGIGKTTLLAAAAAMARARRVLMLRAEGAEIEQALAYGGVRQMLLPPLDRVALSERSSIERRAGAAALAALGTAGDSGSVGEALHGLSAVVMQLAERSPVVVTVDDVQWLDEASITFLAYLARRIPGRPVLILASYRQEHAEARPSLSDLKRSAEVLEPAPLSDAGVQAVLERMLKHLPAADLTAACLAATGGIPFLVEELARFLATVDERSRLAAVEGAGPASIGRAVIERIRRQGEDALALTEAVALFPAGARLVDAAAVAGVAIDAAARTADELQAAAVFAPSTLLGFVHPIVRSAVYDQIGVLRRRQAHLRAAQVLLSRGAPTEETADQLLAAEPVGDARMAEVLETAGLRAEQAGALPAAIKYLERALNEPPAAAVVDRIRARLGRAQLATASPAAERTLRAAVEGAADATDRIDLSLALAEACLNSGNADSAVEAVLAVREAGRDRERRLLVEAALARATWESVRYAEMYDDVVRGLPRDLAGGTIGERAALAQVALRMFDSCEPVADVVATAWRVIGDGKQPLDGPLNLFETAHLLITCGELDTAERLLRDWQELARLKGPDTLYLDTQLALARLAWLRGDLRACTEVVRPALEVPERSGETEAGLHTWNGLVAVAGGDFDGARRSIAAARAASAGFGASISATSVESDLAMAEGRVADAARILSEAAAGLDVRSADNLADSTWRCRLIEALGATSRRDEATGLAERLLVNARRFGALRPLGLLHLALGRITRGPAALGHFEEAVELLQQSPYAGNLASARLELGAALRRANRPAAAREHLRTALDYAHRQRLTPLAARIEEELRLAGGRPRRRVLTGVEALTPSEARICRLAAAGMTNREIADHLFLTVKTVESHVGNALAKLGIASRRELAAVLEATAVPRDTSSVAKTSGFDPVA